MKPWNAVFDQIRVRRDPNYHYAPPTESQLDEVESQIGSRLPESYRAFFRRFGSGELEGWVRLNEIVPQPKKPHQLTVAGRTLELRKYCQDEQYPANWEWLSSLIYFATSLGGDEYAWDPAAVTRSRPHECQFYFLPRHEENKPVAAGRTFAEFIEWIEADARANSEQAPEASITPGFNFHAYHLRKKQPPKPQVVKTWLSFNNDTARDLALAIRNEGRTDALPILADALEEAGCTNADVLDSCRAGDPDIDGVWVINVLIGRG